MKYIYNFFFKFKNKLKFLASRIALGGMAVRRYQAVSLFYMEDN